MDRTVRGDSLTVSDSVRGYGVKYWSRSTHRPLFDQLLPVGEGGQHLQEKVPQLTADEHIQVGLNPRYYQGLQAKVTCSHGGFTLQKNI